MSFLDIWSSLNLMAVSIPTHTDLYLQFDSHHTISAKYSVASNLHHRARAVCSSPQLLHKEHLHSPGEMKIPLMGSQQNKAEDQSSS